MDQKKGAALLVKKFFGCENNEVMSLSSEERVQLASAIARQQGIPADELAFVPVEY